MELLLMELDYNYFICTETKIPECLVCEGENEIRDVKIHWKQKASIQSMEKH